MCETRYFVGNFLKKYTIRNAKNIINELEIIFNFNVLRRKENVVKSKVLKSKIVQ